MTAIPSSPAKIPTNWFRIALLILLAAAIILAVILLPVKELMQNLMRWTHGIGYWACLIYIGADALLTVLFLPSLLLTLTAGALFGLPLGVATMAAGSTLGACIAFLISRYLARGAIQRKIAGHPKFLALEAAVTREGFKIVLLSRISPVFPFKTLNYVFGVTNIPFGTYLAATALGLIPSSFFYVYLGSTTKDVAEILHGDGKIGRGMIAIEVAGLILAIIVTTLIARIAKRAMAEAGPEMQDPGKPKD